MDAADVQITCTEIEAQNLLIYADPCPKAGASIRDALRLLREL
jgi:hypothetical protein